LDGRGDLSALISINRAISRGLAGTRAEVKTPDPATEVRIPA
jgi:hypothetical protein